MCAGSTIMHIYYKDLSKMIQFGPYHPNQATAATFAFRRKLLDETRFDDFACVAEEDSFLKDFTVPFVQLDNMKTILVFSHIHNSVDKHILIDGCNPNAKESDKTVNDFIKDPYIKYFFMWQMDNLLADYHPGKVQHKPDVVKQVNEILQSQMSMPPQSSQSFPGLPPGYNYSSNPSNQRFISQNSFPSNQGFNQMMPSNQVIMVNTSLGQIPLTKHIQNYEDAIKDLQSRLIFSIQENDFLRDQVLTNFSISKNNG
jgi:hypothetical protein